MKCPHCEKDFTIKGHPGSDALVQVANHIEDMMREDKINYNLIPIVDLLRDEAKYIHLAAYEEGKPESLTAEEALAIKKVKRVSTWRRLSMAAFGISCQMRGKWLAEDAARRLTNTTLNELDKLEYKEGEEFSEEHKHALGGCFWWE